MESYSLKKCSLDDFNNLVTKDEIKYELIDGIVLMSPRPNIKHQKVMSNLHFGLKTYLKGKQCEAFTEIELQFKDNVIIPDISVICNLENTNIQRYKKSPEIVIEIISPSSRYTDTFTKLYKYELMGVKEYWIANPETNSITIYNFKNETSIEFFNMDKITSAVFDDLSINLSEIFN